MFRIRLIALALAIWALSGLASAQDAGTDTGAARKADDVIARILSQSPDAPSAPPASALPVQRAPTPAPAGEGPSPGSNPAGPPPVVMSARIGEHADRTRLVLELSDPVTLRTFTLTNPDRVVVDMPEVVWRLGMAPRPSGQGVIRSYRYGLFRRGNSRMVIDLNSPVSVANPLVIPPAAGFGYRMVIDLFPTQQKSFAAGAGWPADLKAKESGAEEKLADLIARSNARPAAEKGRKVVVIDPGHGGLDSGTIGVNGMMEKDLVLAEGQRLARLLADRGYAVHMTRDSDVFVPLPERVVMARKYHADLMISLHADSNPDSTVNGLSIYTLSDGRSDREAAALARRENQSDIIAGVDLSGDNNPVAPILIDLAQRDTINRSAHFADVALTRLASATDILSPSPHRSASLAVLVAPDVPAVLIELGYLSNESDAAQMETGRWRDRVADAIAEAVDRNFAASSASAKFPP